MIARDWLKALLKSPNLEWSEYRPDVVSSLPSRLTRLTWPKLAGLMPRTSAARASLAVAPANDDVVPSPM